MKATNIDWHKATITKEDRRRLYQHHSCLLWFTGLSGAGKSTLANAVEKKLFHSKVHSYVLDGDNIRHGLCSDLGFSPKDRTENIRRIGEVCKLFVDAGIIALSACISPYIADREMVRKFFDKGEYIEIYVKCSLEECERRDPKGLYTKARKGEIQQFTGISAPYEEPLSPELTIETDKLTVEESVFKILNVLKEKKVI